MPPVTPSPRVRGHLEVASARHLQRRARSGPVRCPVVRSRSPSTLWGICCPGPTRRGPPRPTVTLAKHVHPAPVGRPETWPPRPCSAGRPPPRRPPIPTTRQMRMSIYNTMCWWSIPRATKRSTRPRTPMAPRGGSPTRPTRVVASSRSPIPVLPMQPTTVRVRAARPRSPPIPTGRGLGSRAPSTCTATSTGSSCPKRWTRPGSTRPRPSAETPPASSPPSRRTSMAIPLLRRWPVLPVVPPIRWPTCSLPQTPLATRASTPTPPSTSRGARSIRPRPPTGWSARPPSQAALRPRERPTPTPGSLSPSTTPPAKSWPRPMRWATPRRMHSPRGSPGFRTDSATARWTRSTTKRELSAPLTAPPTSPGLQPIPSMPPVMSSRRPMPSATSPPTPMTPRGDCNRPRTPAAPPPPTPTTGPTRSFSRPRRSAPRPPPPSTPTTH